MTDLNRINSTNLDAFTAAGTATPANRDVGAVSTWGVTLAPNTTYYFPFGAPRSPVPAEVALTSVHLQGKTIGLIINSATIEDSNMLATRSPDGRGDAVVTDFDQTVGAWIPENPSTGIVGVVGTGWSSTALTVAAAGTGIGGAMWHLGNMGAGRGRLRIATGATGGVVQVAVRGKAGT